MEFSEEELRNMPPEQVADLQKKNCIFCHIVSGRVATKKVYEDDKCLGILDINPANPGHVLLLPKEHYAIMPLVPEDLIAHMFTVAKHISQAQLRALKAQGTTIMAANGMVAGQRAPHFMIHIIPRKEGDGVGFTFQTKQLAEEDLVKLASAIRKRANVLLGIEAKEPLDLNVRPAKIKAETVQAEFEEEPDASPKTEPAGKPGKRAEAKPDEPYRKLPGQAQAEGQPGEEQAEKEQEEKLEKEYEEEIERELEEEPEEESEEEPEEKPVRERKSNPEEEPKEKSSPKPKASKKAEPAKKTGAVPEPKPKRSSSSKTWQSQEKAKDKSKKEPVSNPKEAHAEEPDLDLISRLF